MRKNNNSISLIAQRAAEIREPIATIYLNTHSELRTLGVSQDLECLPSPFDIADHYNIKYVFESIRGDMPSYLTRDRGTGIIHISNRFRPNSYGAKKLCAHELGHYFLHDERNAYAMNNDTLNYYLDEEAELEYEANVFAISLMPQIMAGQEWEKWSPNKLNRKFYETI